MRHGRHLLITTKRSGALSRGGTSLNTFEHCHLVMCYIASVMLPSLLVAKAGVVYIIITSDHL